MCIVDILVGNLIAVGSRKGRLFNMPVLRQFGNLRQYADEIWIAGVGFLALKHLAQILYCRRNRLNKVLLLLKIPTEAVGPKHL